MDLTGNHLKAARALAGMDQAALADRAGVSINTIRNMEATGAAPVGGWSSTRDKVQAALEKAGIEFTNGGAPGVRLRKAARDSAGESAAARTPPSAPSKKTGRRTPAGRRKGR
jgi:transcriptional regulator with XRE-family HTH domain